MNFSPLRAIPNSFVENVPEPCHSGAERSEAEESRSEDKGCARFLLRAAQGRLWLLGMTICRGFSTNCQSFTESPRKPS